jgi:hypothetical protein
MDMIRGRPQDDNYYYLDVETTADDEEPFSLNRNPAPRDESWTPRQRVSNKGASKVARPARDGARREVIEACIASAAAKMEGQQPVKKARKKSKAPTKESPGSQSQSQSQSPEQSPQSQGASASTQPKAGPSAETETEAEPSASVTEEAPKKFTLLSDSKRPKKGMATAKQRLAKLMKIKHKPF